MYQGTLETISNRADWYGTLELLDDDTGEVITNLDGAVIKIAIRDQYRCPRLSAETGDDHISLLGGGVVQWHFTASEMSGLCAGTYEFGIIVTRDDITDQEMIASLPIIDGIVR